MNLEKGKHLIIQVTGETHSYIAEIVDIDPLILKVTQTGPYSRLKPWDYIILTYPSREFQENYMKYILSCQHSGKNLITGLDMFRPPMEKRGLFNVSHYSKLDTLWVRVKLYLNTLLRSSK